MNRKGAFQVQKVVDQLEKASDYYYNQNKSIMSDEEYDNLRDQLQRLVPNHSFLKKIGTSVKVSEWKKAKHKMPMSSLNKVNVVQEFEKWANEIGNEFIIEDKLDGISIDLEYENGNLEKAITRGDGFEGEDIRSNVQKMKNVKTKLNSFTGSIRGEIVLLQQDFEKVNSILINEGGKALANPRNGGGGIAKRYDSRFSEYNSILYYDITGDIHTEEEKMLTIERMGLKTCFWKKVTIKEAKEIYEKYEEELRAKLQYDIDGLVIKANSLKVQEKHGMINERPKAQIAWKFTSMKKETRLQDIMWSNGNNRRVTPIALLEPVSIGGVTVRKASLHNLANFKKMKLGKDDKVLISRRNDVIPFCEEVIESIGKKFEIPINCPVCKAPLKEDGKFLICPNENCKALDLGNLERWISTLEIKDIGENIIKALYESGATSQPSDYYKLQINDIAKLEGLGIRSAKKILDQLYSKKEMTLTKFLGGLNMNGFASSRAEMLVEAGHDTLEKIQNLTKDDLVKIKGIESKTAEQILKGLTEKKYIIESLLKAGITIVKPQKKQVKSGKLKGFSFCFTGSINKIDENGKRYTRGKMEELVIENGGTIDSVKNGLSFLVQADPNSASSKSQKAKEIGTKILSEEKFFEMIGE